MNHLTKHTNRWLDPFEILSDLQDDFGRLFSPSLRTGIPESQRSLVPSL